MAFIDVSVVWRRVGDDGRGVRAARDAAQVLASARPRGPARASERSPVPLASVAGVVWDDGGVHLVSALGDYLDEGRAPDVPSGGDALPRTPGRGTRRAQVIHRRPGVGGRQLRVVDNARLDGVPGAGEVTWRPASGQAQIGILPMNPAGNAIILARLSSEDRNDSMGAQVSPAIALAAAHSDVLVPRFALLAEGMSGVRYVRPAPHILPPPGTDERDDMVEIDRAIEEGWLEHVIVRDADRIARDMLPAETVLTRWQQSRVGLWICSMGRRVDLVQDRLLLRAQMIVSSEERSNITRRMQLAQINKGPLQGKGWLGTTRFGFRRNRDTKAIEADPEQWSFILRAFELADPASTVGGQGRSTREVTELLAEEGCPFDHDRVRKILSDPIYATGEFTVTVRGIEMEQTPISLDRPVPMARFQRVQNMLALRRGRVSRTPIGEFLFNYVECVHLQCEDACDSRGRPSRLSGAIRENDGPATRTYRHAHARPEQCKEKKFIWRRDDLERPVVEALRQLVLDPDLRTAMVATDAADGGPIGASLTPADRAALQQELESLDLREAALVDEHVRRFTTGEAKVGSAVDAVERILAGISSRRAEIETRLATPDEPVESSLPRPDMERWEEAFLRIMSVATPTDPEAKAVRARLFQALVSRVVIDDRGTGDITLIVEGHLVPPNAGVEEYEPLAGARGLLAALEADPSTDFQPSDDKSVLGSYGELLQLPSTKAHERRGKDSLESGAWRWRRYARHESGGPAWVHTVRVTRAARKRAA